MAYNEITKDQMINGLPADQTVMKNTIDNQKDIKQVVDLDDDLSSLARDIVPDTDNTKVLGSATNAFSNIYTYLAQINKVILGAGTIADLSLSFNSDSSTGFYSPAAGAIDIYLNGFQTVSMDSSKLQVTAGNDRQIQIENTVPGSEALWSIGGDNLSLGFRDLFNGGDLKLALGLDSISAKNPIQVANGVPALPAYSFELSPSSGMYWDDSAQTLGLSVSGAIKLSMNALGLRVDYDETTFNDGTEQNPSINFIGSVQSGLSYDSLDSAVILSLNGVAKMEWGDTSTTMSSNVSSRLVMSTATDLEDASVLLFRRMRGAQGAGTALQLGDLIGDIAFDGIIDGAGSISQIAARICTYASENFTPTTTGTFIALEATDVGQNVGERKVEINKPGSPTVSMLGSFGAKKALINVAGNYTEFNIKNFSVLKVDTSTGSIILSTMGGGEDTQILFVFKSDPANSLTIKHNDASIGQKLFTQNQTDLVLGAGYGGATFICDEGDWKEISIS